MGPEMAQVRARIRVLQCDAVHILVPLMQEIPGISSCTLGEVTAN